MKMKYPVVLQHSEEDCGAACLASIAKHYGRTFTINRIREAVGTGQQGTALLGLKQGAESLGFNARGVKALLETIDENGVQLLPAIVHSKGYHWVVLYGKRGKKYAIADPAAGIRYLDRKELTESWKNGVMLWLKPDPVRFWLQPDEKEKIGGMARFLKRVWPYRAILAEALLTVFYCFSFSGLDAVLQLETHRRRRYHCLPNDPLHRRFPARTATKNSQCPSHRC